jgi:capsule polysaccharide modification protein KpsS
MSYFEVTPVEIASLGPLFLDEVTGRWIVPTKVYTTFVPPAAYDPVNDNKYYQKRTIEHFDYLLRNKWLHRKVEFRKLLKYFILEKKDDKVTVKMIDNLDKAVSQSYNDQNRRYIFDYIESVFLGENTKFVEGVLREYVKRAKAKWYDLVENYPTIIELLAKRLRRRIERTIVKIGEDAAEK